MNANTRVMVKAMPRCPNLKLGTHNNNAPYMLIHINGVSAIIIPKIAPNVPVEDFTKVTIKAKETMGDVLKATTKTWCPKKRYIIRT